MFLMREYKREFRPNGTLDHFEKKKGPENGGS